MLFVPRGLVTEGDEVEFAAAGSVDAADLKPAYRRWAEAGPPDGAYGAVVVSVNPAGMLDREAGAARHILSSNGAGDLVVLRVFDEHGPVLSDEAFAARIRSVEGALRQ